MELRIKNKEGMLAFILYSLFFILVLIPAGPAYAAKIGEPTNNLGLAAYWPLDGNTTNWVANTTADISGNGNTGTLENMSIGKSLVAGKFGQALQFDGSSTDFRIASTTSLADSIITVSAWVKSQSTGFEQVIYEASTYSLEFYSGGQIGLSSYGGITATPQTTGTYFGAWHHVVYTADGTNLNIYVDGVLVKSAAGTVTNPYGGKAVGSSSSRYFNGAIDDVRVYNRALSAQEIMALYNAGGHVGRANTASVSNGLIGYWPFDGADTNWTTNTTLDVSGQGNNGTLTSMSAATSPVVGKIGQALQFTSASNQYINLGNNYHLAANGSFSIALWVKPNAIARNELFSKANGFNYAGSEYSFFLESTGQYELDVGDGTGDSVNAGNTHYIPGVWQHLLVEFDATASKMYFYRNGVYDGSGTYTRGAPNSNSVNAVIGSLGGNYYYFKGSMDDVRVYNRVLSAPEVAQLYDLGATNVAHSNTTALSSGLVGYWTMDGSHTNWGTGKEDDSSGNGNAGQLLYMSTTTSPTIGKVGQGLNFTGSGCAVGSYIQASTSPIITGVNWTMSAWIKTTVTNLANGNALYAERAPSGLDIVKFDLAQSSNSFGVTMRNDAGTVIQDQSSIVINDNKWHFITATKAGSVITLYADDKAPTTFSWGGTDVYTNANRVSWIAADAGDACSHFAGTLDELRIYNRALSAAEVHQLYMMSL